MEDIVAVKIAEANYENVIAICPYCGCRNIYNRQSDLKTLEPIANREVNCQNESCNKQYDIICDSINSKFEMLIFDCETLKKDKQYSRCILNLAQAYEVFFSDFLKVRFIYEPFASSGALDDINNLLKLLYETIKDYSFAHLRNIFIRILIADTHVEKISEAKDQIMNLKCKTTQPSKREIELVDDTELRERLISLNETGIHTLRNNIVHKNAYRPSLEEVDSAIDETRKMIFFLKMKLKVVSDDINTYR